MESGVDSRDVSGEVSSVPEACKIGMESLVNVFSNDDSAYLFFKDAAPWASDSLYNLCIKRRCASSLLGTVPRYICCDSDVSAGVVWLSEGPLGISVIGSVSCFFRKNFITMIDR